MKSPAQRILNLSGILGALLISSDTAFAQCPMCKRALVHSAEGAALSRGFNAGILFLLIVPFVLFGIVAFLFYRAQRRTRYSGVLPDHLNLRIFASLR